jgi:hypothetical protein
MKCPRRSRRKVSVPNAIANQSCNGLAANAQFAFSGKYRSNRSESGKSYDLVEMIVRQYCHGQALARSAARSQRRPSICMPVSEMLGGIGMK